MISLRHSGRTVKSEAPEKRIQQAKKKLETPSDITVGRLASLSGTGNGELQFESQDWADYADLSKLPRRSGVSSDRLRRLVLKELVDNALDECDRFGCPGQATISRIADNTYTVTDEGEGLNGTPQQLAEIFSLRRPKATSKLWRLPKRGAVGNGIRVIVGAVASGGGRIVIETRGQRMAFRPQAHNGITEVESVIPIKLKPGTSITIGINPRCPKDEHELSWAETAIYLAAHGAESVYRRRANPLWLDLDHLCEMLRSVTPGTSVRDFTSKLDGCTSSESRKQITQAFGLRKLCSDMTREQSGHLLCLLQRFARPVKAKYLGLLGDCAWDTQAYAKGEGEFETGDNEPTATIPFVVECWATAIGREFNRIGLGQFTINRTPAIGESRCQRGFNRAAFVTLCGCSFEIDVAEGQFEFALNLTSPCIPIVSEGKMPDLSPFKEVATEVIEKALNRASKFLPKIVKEPKPPKSSKAGHVGDGEDVEEEEEEEEKPERIILRKVIWEVIPEAVEHCCFKDGVPFFEFNQRDLYYAVRILVKDRGGEEPKYPYFTTVLTDYENEVGEIDLITRDARGVFSEPGGPLISMGTKSVAAYQRPAWEYSNFLFVEKEKIVTLLKQVHFDVQWDCFIMTSKGFCTRAGKDLLDKVAAKDDPTKFFSVHDADASGPLISQTLVNATKTRCARNVEVIDLGFFPWTALKEGLLKEPVEKKRRKNRTFYRRPVADCVKARDAERNPEDAALLGESTSWENWLQDWRVELNAMAPPEFVVWINAQFEKHGASKTVPPESIALPQVTEIIQGRLADETSEAVRAERQEELIDVHKAIDEATRELRRQIDEITEPFQKQIDKIHEEIDQEIETRTTEVLEETEMPTGAKIIEKIKEWLKEHINSHWRDSIHEVASELIPERE